MSCCGIQAYHIRRNKSVISQFSCRSPCERPSRTISGKMLASLILVLTIVQRNPLGYNVDVLNARVYDDPTRASGGRRSYFGFSVALYTSPKESLLLVGAPRANSSVLTTVIEPGTVFKCAMNGACGEWVIDKTGNGPHPRERLINQLKDNAWIGATVVVENRTEPRVVVRRYFSSLCDNNQKSSLKIGASKSR